MAFVNHAMFPIFVTMRVIAIRKHIDAKDYIKSTKLVQITLNDIVAAGVFGIGDKWVAKIIEYLKTALVMLLMRFDKLALIELRNVVAELEMDLAVRRRMIARKDCKDVGDLDALPFDVRELISEMI